MLQGDIPAGTWTLVCDGIIIQPVDVEFELIWRHVGGGDVPLATWNQHFDPRGNGDFDAIPCELTAETEAVDWTDGDQLVFRYTGTTETNTPMAYIPVGNPIAEAGRNLNLTLPR